MDSGSNSFTIIPHGDKLLKFSLPNCSTAYYKNKKINLLTGEASFSSLEEISFLLESIKLKIAFDKPTIIHLFYELGFFFNGLTDLIKEDHLLLILIKYDEVGEYLPCNFKSVNLTKTNGPSVKSYRHGFKEGQSHLKSGNCYQFNLTSKYLYSVNIKESEEIIDRLWSDKTKRGAYGHATYLPFLKRVILSNSPECLFQIKKEKKQMTLESMPIKGSVSWDGSEKDYNKQWGWLSHSEKNESELFMITDLIRNDLSRIENPLAKVLFKKRPLIVPGIIHQYSKVSIKLSYGVSLYNILKSLFPGGSITGAPKKRVMEILHSIELAPRGIYCGSTLVLYKNILASSINIRTADIDLKNGLLDYGAGGGITLLSSVDDEYAEMELKVDSFIDILKEVP